MDSIGKSVPGAEEFGGACKPILDTIPYGVIITDDEFRIQTINTWIQSHIDLSNTNWRNENIFQVFPELNTEKSRKILDVVFQSGQQLTLSNRLHKHFLKIPQVGNENISYMPQSTVISPLKIENNHTGLLIIINDVTERILTEQSLEKELDKLNILHEIDQALSTLDLDECLKLIVRHTSEIFQANCTALYLVKDESLEITQSLLDENCILRKNLSDIQDVLEKRQPVLNYHPIENTHQNTKQIVSEMIVPFIFDNEVLGVIVVQSVEEYGYEDEDIGFLSIIASRASIAINNATIHYNENFQRKYAEIINEINLSLTSELDPDWVLDEILKKISLIIPYDSASILLLENDSILKAERQIGYEKYNMEDEVQNFILPLEQVPGLQDIYFTKKPLLISNTNDYPGWKNISSSQIKSWLGAPIIVRGKMLGFLSLDKIEEDFYQKTHLDLISGFATHAAIALNNAKLYKSQTRLAMTDELTGLLNRREFNKRLSNELERSIRYNNHIGLLMVDIDNFKNLNDRFGHQIGDNYLINVAAILQKGIRNIDTPTRFGGEEFAIILPQTDSVETSVVANRLRADIAALNQENALPDSPIPDLGITISIGCAIAPKDANNVDDLIKAADTALYAAKKAGKNQCIQFSDLDQ